MLLGLGFAISSLSAIGLGSWTTYLLMREKKPAEPIHNPSPTFEQGDIVATKLQPDHHMIYVWVYEERPDKGNLVRCVWYNDEHTQLSDDYNVYTLKLVKRGD